MRSFEQTQANQPLLRSSIMNRKEDSLDMDKNLKASTLLRTLKDLMKQDVVKEIKRSLKIG